jgi:hypothetical protein
VKREREKGEERKRAGIRVEMKRKGEGWHRKSCECAPREESKRARK